MITNYNTRQLIIAGKEFRWNYESAKKVLLNYCKNGGNTKEHVYGKLAEICDVTVEAVKNWFKGHNGPGKGEYVSFMAEFFGVNYRELVKEDNPNGRSSVMEKVTNRLIDSFSEEAERVKHQTISLIGILNELAYETQKGYMGFNEYVNLHEYAETSAHEPGLYWPSYRLRPGIIYIDEPGEDYGKVVCDMCVDFNHIDIISTLDSILLEKCGCNYTTSVLVDDEDQDETSIFIYEDGYLVIVVEDGRWYCV